MGKHDHEPPKPPCAPETLKHCAQCDAVECQACGKEWKPASATIFGTPLIPFLTHLALFALGLVAGLTW